jgi:hypothetical protein
MAVFSNAAAVDVDDFRDQIVGKTVTMYHTKKDMEFTRYFAEDGTLKEIHPTQGYRTGNWSIDGDELCLAISGTSAKCRRIVHKHGVWGTSNKKGNKLVVEFNEFADGDRIPAPRASDEPVGQIHEELVTLDTRPGVTQSFLLIEPRGTPKGVVLLYPGHEGVVRFHKVGDQYSVENEGGGLTAHERIREILSQSGYVTVVLAPPSDHSSGMDTKFRFSDEHAEDARVVIAYLNRRYNHKVYVEGHCRSTFSPPAVIGKLNNEGIAGMILSSTRSEGKQGSVMDLPSSQVKVPVLLVHHVDDPCKGTPFRRLGDVRAFYAKSAPEVAVITVSGGSNERGSKTYGCSGGYHGFKDMRRPVVEGIVEWLEGDRTDKSITP